MNNDLNNKQTDVVAAESSAEISPNKQQPSVAKQQSGRINVNDGSQEDKIYFGEQFVHPYFDEDPSLGLLKKNYQEPSTLMHGCSCVPQSYQTVSRQDLNSCEKLHVTNWMENVKPPSAQGYFDYVEVRFKNSHKDFYKIPEGLEITEGDIVAVEGTPGHDIGIVSLTGELCRIQMKKKKGFNIDNVKKLYRRAKSSDIEKWIEVMKKEDATLFATRKMALDGNLDMKINDVEYQGDGTKAIFYYTANDRVDFRQLIKQLAEAFHIKIEMKQIGVRQEAGRLGGIGTCGRELCCSTWLNNFTSVGTSVAKVQQLFPNPQKLAGQCGKLKCCLNYEYDVYQDALKDFPPTGVDIETEKGKAVYRKIDVLKHLFWYSYKDSSDLIPVSASTVKKLLDMVKKNKKIDDLENYRANTAVNAKQNNLNEKNYQ
ncbi:MAG: hypothetical protein J6M30_06585 [Bacteroidales bacterium]|nr:hypothetical protein [Bacteroidales bacterium]